MKYSRFLTQGFYKEGEDYPHFETVKSLNERRYLSSIIWLWKDCSPLHHLLQEKRFAERQACKAQNYKVCQYWCDRANSLSRRIRIDRHWYHKFEKALACEQYSKAQRILHVASGSFLYHRGKQLAWNWLHYYNIPISQGVNIPDPEV